MLPTLVVPFATGEPERERAFTSEMEKATILCLAEAKRRKPRILRGATEEIEYIAKLYYPLWGIPWRERCIVVDGLGLLSATTVETRIPNVLDFTEDLKKSSSSFSFFRESLKKHSQTFERPASTRKEVTEAIVGDGRVLGSLSSLVKQAERVEEEPRQDVVLLPFKFPKEEAERKAASFIGKWTRLRAEVDALQYGLQILEEMVGHHKEKISMEIEQIWGEYEERITEMKRLVDKRINQLNKRRERETGKALKLYDKRLKEAVRQEGKLRQKIEELKGSLKEQRKRRKGQKRRYPKRSTTRIDNRIESCRRKVKELSRKVRELPESKDDINGEREASLTLIEQEYLALAAKEMEKLEILEQSRNLEVSEKREEVKDREAASSSIEAQINRLIEQKRSEMKGLEGRTLPLQVRNTVLVGIPFYLVQYKSTRGARTEICPPAIVASYEGMMKKIQRTIWSFNLEARIQLLLSPRSPELNDEIFTNFRKSVRTDSDLREAVSEIGTSRNLLELPEFKEEAAKGLKELETEGWLNPEEGDKILSVLPA